MRKLAAIVVFFIATAAFAQERPNGIFVFVTNPGGGTSSSGGSYWEGAFGLALQRMFTPNLSAEVSVSRDRQRSTVVAFDSSGNVAGFRTFTDDFTPVDLTARYHFLNNSSWKPYAGIGARYVEGRAVGGLTGGVVWQFRPSLGLRFDGKVFLGNQSQFTDVFNGSVGLAWRF